MVSMWFRRRILLYSIYKLKVHPRDDHLVRTTVINFFETVRKSELIRKISSQIEDEEEDQKTEIILQ